MSELPINLLWGVDIAIKKLRPTAEFTLSGTVFTEYYDPFGSEPPSWQEVIEQLNSDKAAAEKWLSENQ